jgi:hypothetical protein
MNLIHALTFTGWLSNVKLAHWQADTLGTAHQTLGWLYDEIEPLVDELAEVTMGKRDTTDFPAGQSALFTPGVALVELMEAGIAESLAIRAELNANDDHDLLKILDEIEARINRAKFLLKVTGVRLTE